MRPVAFGSVSTAGDINFDLVHSSNEFFLSLRGSNIVGWSFHIFLFNDAANLAKFGTNCGKKL